MSEVKTVDSTISTDLLVEQARDVANMRASLLSLQKGDPNSARKAIQNVTILRVYHQLERIVRYTELVDQIEDKMYQSIELKLQNADADDENLWSTLIPMQERLQRMMIESHKLLEPYLSPELLAPLEVTREEDPSTSFTSMLLEQESREKVRNGVQQLMDIINTFDSTAVDVVEPQPEVQSEVHSEDESELQTKAQKALAKIESQEGTNSDD